MRRFDAILFDAGETLIRPHPSFPELIEGLLAEQGYGIGADGHARIERAMTQAFTRAADEQGGFSLSAELSRRFWTELYRDLLVELEITDPDGALALHLYTEFSRPERYKPFDDTFPALEALRGDGYRLGIVSNWEAWLESLLRDLGLAPLMEVTVVSGSVGIEKPDPRIFEQALGGLGLPPERVVYVGDSLRYDIEPAVALGMTAVLIDRRGRYADVEPAVRALTDLPAVLA